MRKNGSREISFSQYRTTDLFLFSAIMIVAEVTAHYAIVWFPGGAMFTFSFLIPICLIVMLRWGWFSVIYAIISAVLYCVFNSGAFTDYITFVLGNSFVLLALIPLSIWGKERFVRKRYLMILLVIFAWASVYLGRASVFAVCRWIQPIEGVAPYAGFVKFATSDFLSLVMAVIVLLGLRHFDGMLEDQKAYLIKLGKLREERYKSDKYGEEPYEVLDEEALSILHRDNDMY